MNNQDQIVSFYGAPDNGGYDAPFSEGSFDLYNNPVEGGGDARVLAERLQIECG